MENLTETKIAAFKRMFTEGMERIKDACALYVEAIDNDSSAGIKFRDAFPAFSESMWSSFELVGRGAMHEKLLYMNGRAASKLRRLPISVQKEALEKGVSVLTSENESLLTRIESMKAKQIDMVFASDHIRNLGEQRSYIEAAKLKKAVIPKQSSGYEIKGSRVYINEPMELTKSDLLRMLEALK